MRRLDRHDHRVEPGFEHAVLNRRSNRPVNGPAYPDPATEFLQTEPEGPLSPSDIIARAAASVPENLDPESEKNSLLPDAESWSDHLSQIPPRARTPRHHRMTMPGLPHLPFWMTDLRRMRRVVTGVAVMAGAVWGAVLRPDIKQR